MKSIMQGVRIIVFILQASQKDYLKINLISSLTTEDVTV